MMMPGIQATPSATQTGESCDSCRRMQLECLRPPQHDIPGWNANGENAAFPVVP